ncbi:outer membrane beta-barrel protein [Lewinella sp. IMCC34191]|uniref:outer membrane beta-barrel protein n=1 Tax=Lewinella sp. IMCC34191 TaxID=2259172 RepID=UPI00130088A2|nr:outer membrane beta-barrel protein [Lewinella sp. IMCC34191]
MRHLLTLIFICICGFVNAQRSSLDLSTGLHYSFTTFSKDDQSQHTSTIAGEDRGIVTGQVGIHYRRRLSETNGLRTGLRLSELGYHTMLSGLRWGTQHDGQGGFDPAFDPGQPDELSRRTNRFFLEVPLIWQRTFGARAWIPYLEAGFLPGAYLTSRSRQEDDNGTTVTYYDESNGSVHRFQLSAALSMGIEYGLSERHALFVQANGRHQLRPLAEGPIKERLYAIGIEVGVRRGLQ